MAKVATSFATSSAGGGDVFASVFSASGVGMKPPRHRGRFSPSATARIPEIKSALHSQLRVLLGIGDEAFVYGVADGLPNAATAAPFHSHFGSCLLSADRPLFRQPTEADRAARSAREAESPLWGCLRDWKAVVGGETVKKLLAAVFDDLLTEFVAWSYAGVYREGLDRHLEFWVRHLFAAVAHAALSALDHPPGGSVLAPPPPTEVRRWKDMAVARLGALRVDELFEVIVDWDATAPAVADLRHFTTNPATRGYLTHEFSHTLQTRLLHPGASTVEILQLYISIIRAFRILDPKGVLLDRVARKVRRYLREREDTVRVIVTGLLSDPHERQDQQVVHDPDVLTELAVELGQHGGGDDDDGGGAEFDWNNMDWVPDPIDAAPDYMRSKNVDVIGSLITLFESKDVFVKELQSTLADRLLKNKPDFNQEIGVLEHLKLRFGESVLQGCEVMLRDVLDSRKVDTVVRRDQQMDHDDDDGVQLHAKILSRLFWPSMPEQTFKVPAAVAREQEKYEAGFEALKQSRKLTWLNAIGQVEVELELEDRFVNDKVLPWQAAVIYAFQDHHEVVVVKKTVAELARELDMSPTLVRSACIFWVSKQVLMTDPAKDTFVVLERLPDDSSATTDDGRPPPRGLVDNTAAATAAAEAAAIQATREADEQQRQTQMAMYHQFVVSMLTNQGPMPLPRIAMMLGIVVPGGFPFSNEELKEFLAGMVKDGVLDVGHGGAYKVASS